MSFPTKRIAAGITGLLHGGLALVLAPLALGIGGNAAAAVIFLVLFGLGAVAGLLHAFPRLADGRPLLQVRPGTVKAVAVFFAASLHGMVALGAIGGLFFADTLWRSVPLFFGAAGALLSVSLLFATSAYFLYALERLTFEEGAG